MERRKSTERTPDFEAECVKKAPRWTAKHGHRQACARPLALRVRGRGLGCRAPEASSACPSSARRPVRAGGARGKRPRLQNRRRPSGSARRCRPPRSCATWPSRRDRVSENKFILVETADSTVQSLFNRKTSRCAPRKNQVQAAVTSYRVRLYVSRYYSVRLGIVAVSRTI